MMKKVDARGEQCPIPVVRTKEAIADLQGKAGSIEVLVDNEIAVQNLMKMAKQKGYGICSEQLGQDFRVVFTLSGGAAQGEAAEPAADTCDLAVPSGDVLVVISSDCMGTGDEVLGKTLLKGFIFALSKGDILPKKILFYNRGAFMTTEGSESIADLQSLAQQGTEICTCGTCLNHYGLADKLAVGSVTNMYEIASAMMQAGKIVKP